MPEAKPQCAAIGFSPGGLYSRLAHSFACEDSETLTIVLNLTPLYPFYANCLYYTWFSEGVKYLIAIFRSIAASFWQSSSKAVRNFVLNSGTGFQPVKNAAKMAVFLRNLHQNPYNLSLEITKPVVFPKVHN